MDSVAVAEIDEGAHLVEGHEVLDAVGEALGDVTSVVGEGLGGVAGPPAALVFKGLGEIPVKSVRAGCRWREARRRRGCRSRGPWGWVCRHPGGRSGPCDREAVGLEAEPLHELHVFLVAVVVVVGYVAGVAVFDLAGGVGEGVPDGGAAAVFVDGSFDLIGGGCRAPEEALWEAAGSRRCRMALICQGGERGEYGGGERGRSEESGEGASGKSI